MGGRQFLRVLATVVAVLVQAAWAGGNYKVLHNFGATGDGAVPAGPPLLARGNLYGATGAGGTSKMCEDYGCGTAFELTPGTNGKWRGRVLYDFQGQYTDGRPVSGLVLDEQGNLYGASAGGPNDLSNVFELTPQKSGWAFDLIYDLGAGDLTLDKLGNIYGVMGSSAHVYPAISELSRGSSGWNYTALYVFCSENHCFDGDGSVPDPLSWDAKGNLYGVTLYGGNGNGVAFELSRTTDPASDSLTWTYHVTHHFGETQRDGQHPYSSVVVDRQGNVFGSTLVGGGSANAGTLFKIAPVAPGRWRETVLFNFPAFANGAGPQGNLVMDAAGALYGVTQGGGNSACQYGCGVVFELKPTAHGKWKYSVVHTFNGQDGFDPIGLTIDSKGNLFGTTVRGGTYNLGVAFEITP